MSSAACVSVSVFGKQCEGFCQDASRHVLLPVGFASVVQQDARRYPGFALACSEGN